MFESKTSALSKEKLFGVFSRDMKSTISSLELERHERSVCLFLVLSFSKTRFFKVTCTRLQTTVRMKHKT